MKQIKNALIRRGFYPKFLFNGTFVLEYHGVDLIENKKYNSRFIKKEKFEGHLKFLKRNFSIVPISQVFENNLPKNKLNIAITFDDGYSNNFKYAFPLLEKYEIPATIFVTGLNEINQNILWADLLEIGKSMIKEPIEFENHIFIKNTQGYFFCEKLNMTLSMFIKKDREGGYSMKSKLNEFILGAAGDFRKKKELEDYWKLLSDDEIRTIGKSKFVKIGSHGYYHNNLGNIPIEKALEELAMSKKYLENLVQYEVNSIGYPDGSYSYELPELASQMGFCYQLVDKFSFPRDHSLPYLRERIGIYPQNTRTVGELMLNFGH